MHSTGALQSEFIEVSGFISSLCQLLACVKRPHLCCCVRVEIMSGLKISAVIVIICIKLIPKTRLKLEYSITYMTVIPEIGRDEESHVVLVE